VGCRGVYFALSSEQEQRLLAARSDDDLMTVVESIEEQWDEEHVCETDKAWDGIDRVLGDRSLSQKGKISMERVILGGKSLHKGEDYVMRYLTAAEVTDLAPQLLTVTEPSFRECYFALAKKTFFTIVPSDSYAEFVSEEDFGYCWAYFESIRDFFQKAAQENRAIVFTVDQ
jgi:hypothetical protein